jgi:hypothetical protein
MRNCAFESAGGVKRDAASLFMPPCPSGPVYVIITLVV